MQWASHSGAGEFGFELEVCAWAEQRWPPDGDTESAVLVGRQVGTRERRWDTVIIEADPAGLAQRRAFGKTALDDDLLDVVQHAPETWTWYRDAIPEPDYPWRYVREAVHRAGERGVAEVRQGSDGRIELRRIANYPDWVDRVIAIENKPDLDASAAAALADQLDYDVALGLADEVWLATKATGERVEPALLADQPVEAGVLVFDGDRSPRVRWHPASLAVGSPGTRIVDRPDQSAHDHSAARFDYVKTGTKARQRLRIAERVYGRGWRSYVDTMRPDCRHFSAQRGRWGWRPFCRAKKRSQRAAECAGSCSDFEPEPPTWRQMGWPIDGGPGKTITQLLEQRRERQRPGVSDTNG